MWREFEYLKPITLQEACSLRLRYGEDARIMAGGTDLLVKMKQRIENPKYLIDIKGISGLDEIYYEANRRLRIGALVTLRTLETAEIVRKKFDIIAEAARTVGSVQVRSKGTTGGNLCNASPAADTAIPLIAMDAAVEICGLKGTKTMPLESFFEGPGKTTLKQDELLTEILVPEPPPNAGRAFAKHGIRNLMEIAVASVAVSIEFTDRICKRARIALGSVAPAPIRAIDAEEVLVGEEFGDELVEKAAETAAKEIRPISDIRSSAEYRRRVTRVLVRRALTEALRRAGR